MSMTASEMGKIGGKKRFAKFKTPKELSDYQKKISRAYWKKRKKDEMRGV